MGRKRLVLLGPPGAGKGTQAKVIAVKTGLVHLSTGDILRDEVSRGSQLGQEAKQWMDRGDLVPDKLITDMIEGEISKVDGFILDGFPRTITQAKALEEVTPVDIAINIVLSRDDVIKRLSSRRTCRDCGTIYNSLFSPPRVDGRCDMCDGELSQRSDDHPGVIRKRFDVYTRQTAPLIDLYRKQGTLQEIDGNLPPEEVLERIMALLVNDCSENSY